MHKGPSAPREPAVTILHVSDLQFGRNHRFGRLGLGDPDERFDSLQQRLCDDLDRLKAAHGIRPGVIALTGDLAEWGLKKEFDDVLGFADGLRRHLELAPDRVLVIPGNHDINRKKCEAYFNDREGDGERPEPPYWPKWRPYVDFFGALYKEVERYRFTQHEPWTLYELPELKVIFAGLNSTLRESHRAEDHYGWLGEGQLRWFQEKLQPYKDQGWLRIGLVHHNVLRRAEADDENLRDAEALERYLGDTLNLLLHGHTHLGRIETLGELPVLSTGSAGVKQEQRPEEVPNQYQVIRIHRGGLCCWARQYTVQRKQWIADPRVSKNGNDWWQERKLELVHVRETFPPPEQAREPSGSLPTHGSLLDEVARSLVDRAGRQGLRDSRAIPDSFFDIRFDIRRNDFLQQVIEVCELRCEGRPVRVERVRHEGPFGPYARVTESERGTYVLGAIDGSLDAARLRLWIQDVHEPFRSRSRQPSATSHLVVASTEPIPEPLAAQARQHGAYLERWVDYQRILDVESYRADLLRRIEADPIYPRARYIEQRITAWSPAAPEERAVDGAADWIVSRMQEPEGSFVLALGPAGVGKTFLLHEVAYRLATSQQLVTPLLIDLRNLDYARDVLDLAAAHFTLRRLVFQPRAFERDLREGRIALLFDGFDELALRVRSSAIPAHFERILSAAREQARIVVTSRAEHFLSQGQVEGLMTAAPTSMTVLGGAFQSLARRHIVAVRPFERADVERYLVQALGAEGGRARFQRLRAVHDLVGLATNPRMLGFLVDIPEDKLAAAAKLKDAITSADLYRLVVEESWLAAEQERLRPPGAAPGPSVEALRDAATRLALHLWTNTAHSVATTELSGHVGDLLTRLCDGDLDRATQTLRARTLLTRNDEGHVSFIHQTVMEWLVACALAEEIKKAGQSAHLGTGRLNEFLIDLLRQLLGEEALAAWAFAALEALPGARLSENARDVLKRLGREARQRAELRGEDLRGQDLRGQDLRGAQLEDADLSGVRLLGRDLRGASLARARLAYADLSDAKLAGADLRGADLSFARLHRADLEGAKLEGARLRGASFLEAKGTLPPGLEHPHPHRRRAAPVPETVPRAMPCYSVAHSPDGYLLASGHEDGSVCIWDRTQARLLWQRVEHRAAVRSVAFSPDGRTLASGSADKTVHLWSVDLGTELRVLAGHKADVLSVAFSPDGRTLASGSVDKTVRLWSMDSGRELTVLTGHLGAVVGVAFSPQGPLLASASADKTVRLWRVDTSAEPTILKGHTGTVWSVAFSPDGRTLASASADRTLRLWSAAEAVRELGVLIGHTEDVLGITFSPNGRLLASGSEDRNIRLWSVDSHTEVAVFSGHMANVWSVAFSPDGRTLASASSDDTIRLWSVDPGKECAVLSGHSAAVWSVAFSPDGRTLASAATTDAVRLWSVDRGTELGVLCGHLGTAWCVAFSRQGSTLASASSDNSIRLWNPERGAELGILRGHSATVLSMDFSPDGRRLASASADKTLRVWDLTEGRKADLFSGHSQSVVSVAFSPQGSTLASASEDKTVRLWSVDQGTELKLLKGHTATVWSVAFSPQGRVLASGSADKTIRLWNAEQGTERLVLAGHTSSVLSVAFSPDGHTLASASEDKTVRLWSVGRGTELQILRGHGGAIWSVAFSPNGLLLATGSLDATTRLWDVRTGRCLAIFYSNRNGAVAYRPDGRYRLFGDVSGHFWHTLGLHRYEPGELDELLPGLRLAEDEPLIPSAPLA